MLFSLTISPLVFNNRKIKSLQLWQLQKDVVSLSTASCKGKNGEVICYQEMVLSHLLLYVKLIKQARLKVDTMRILFLLPNVAHIISTWEKNTQL